MPLMIMSPKLTLLQCFQRTLPQKLWLPFFKNGILFIKSLFKHQHIKQQLPCPDSLTWESSTTKLLNHCKPSTQMSLTLMTMSSPGLSHTQQSWRTLPQKLKPPFSKNGIPFIKSLYDHNILSSNFYIRTLQHWNHQWPYHYTTEHPATSSFWCWWWWVASVNSWLSNHGGDKSSNYPYQYPHVEHFSQWVCLICHVLNSESNPCTFQLGCHCWQQK